MNLPSMDVAARLPRLRARLDDAGCEALLVTNLKNIRYLTGFTGSAGLLLVLPDEECFFECWLGHDLFYHALHANTLRAFH